MIKSRVKKHSNLSLILLSLTMLLVSVLAACNNAGADTGSGGTILATNTPSSTTVPVKSTVPLTAIRMLDQLNGWALTQSSILTTSDGGMHWQDVTPTNAVINTTSRGDFTNNQTAWISTAQEQAGSISILHTTDRGKNWKSSEIITDFSAGTDMAHFLSPTEGWLQAIGSPGAGNRPSAVFHTTDGGQNWSKLSTTYGSGSNYVVRANGISFEDTKNGWVTGDGGAGAIAPQPLLGVTHNGGLSWQAQAIPALAGVDNNDLVETTPPVFFGGTGLLPVIDGLLTKQAVNLYVTHDNGQTWAATERIIIGTSTIAPPVYAVDAQHVWTAGSDGVFATGDGGKHWEKIAQPVQQIGEFSFVSATNGWAIGQRGQNVLLHTTNGGKTWQQINYTIQ